MSISSYRRLSISLFFAGFLALLYIFVVFAPAPLGSDAISDWGNYPNATKVGKEEWDRKWVDLRVTISNPSNRDYTDLDIPIMPDLAVVKVWQRTEIPDVSFIEDFPALVDLSLRNKDERDPTAIQNPGIIASRGVPYRVRCPLLPKLSNLEIVFALVNDGSSSGDTNVIPREWMASPLPKKLPQKVTITGTFKLMGREHRIAETRIPVGPK